MESLVLLALSVLLLWVATPVVLVNMGLTKAPESARSQPVLVQPPVLSMEQDDEEVELPKLPPIQSYMEKPVLPESLEKVTKGGSPVPLPQSAPPPPR